MTKHEPLLSLDGGVWDVHDTVFLLVWMFDIFHNCE